MRCQFVMGLKVSSCADAANAHVVKTVEDYCRSMFVMLFYAARLVTVPYMIKYRSRLLNRCCSPTLLVTTFVHLTVTLT